MAFRETPVCDLTRHFFREFFYLRFLTDTGADSIKRATIGHVSGLLALSILFPQFVVGRYATMRTVEEYRRALLSDQLFTICVAMFIVGFVAALVCQSLFPDETDYRVLTPLPSPGVWCSRRNCSPWSCSRASSSSRRISSSGWRLGRRGRAMGRARHPPADARPCLRRRPGLDLRRRQRDVRSGLIAVLSPRAYLRSVSW
jgi:hypothetical protein